MALPLILSMGAALAKEIHQAPTRLSPAWRRSSLDF